MEIFLYLASQDYLIVTERNDEEDGRKDNDMYVYFQEKDGAWTTPINLGNTINTSFNEKGPSEKPAINCIRCSV